MKLTIDEFSKEFKMSKEMIHSKIKNKELDYVVEDDTIYIIPKDELIKQKQTQPIVQEVVEPSSVVQKPKLRPTVSTILALYQRENKQLKEKIIQLEAKIDKLIEDKERMLKEERDRLEEIYNTKDEQLKDILTLIQSNMQQNSSTTNKDSIKPKEQSKLIELKDYLKTLDLKSSQKKAIKKRFLEVYDSDIRIIQQNGKLYLDLSKYDYSDLLAF